jgi:transposase InsO family protein
VIGGDKKEIMLRGIALYPPTPTQSAEKEYEDIAGMNANTVRLALRYKFFYEPAAPDSYKESAWKWLDVYIKDYRSVREAINGLRSYFEFYNRERIHQSLEYQTPEAVYRQGRKPAAVTTLN